MKKLKRSLISIFLITVLLLNVKCIWPARIAYAAEPAPSFMTVHFLDVGQGDATLIQCDGHNMLIDGGNADRSQLIHAYLKNAGISTIDYIIATHSDEDHVGGLAAAVNATSVGAVYSPVIAHDTKAFKNLQKRMSLKGLSFTLPSAGDVLPLGSAVVTIIGPRVVSENTNDNSIVLRVTHGNNSFLFTGDAEADEENNLLASNTALNSTVLKVGHHGSDTSTGNQFLKKIAPRFAVISAGANNTYGHPTAGTLAKLKNAGIMTYRTDIHGTILCVSDGVNIGFAPAKNADADPFAAPVSMPFTITPPNNLGVPSKEVPSTITYVLNKRSLKFHYDYCNSVKKMSEKNKLVSQESRDQIIARGYVPCKNCKP